KMVMLSVLIPCERAIFLLSPVTMKAWPRFVAKNNITKIVMLIMVMPPIIMLSKYLGKVWKKLAEKKVVFPIKETLDPPMIRKLTDKEPVITKIPANKMGILPLVYSKPVIRPPAAPARKPYSVANIGEAPLVMAVTVTAAPRGKVPSTVISGKSKILKVKNKATPKMAQSNPCPILDVIKLI